MDETCRDCARNKVCDHDKYGWEKCGNFLDESIVKSALIKRVQMKPIGDLHSVPHYRCPDCFGGVVIYEDSRKFPFCHHCGQALDWGEEE